MPTQTPSLIESPQHNDITQLQDLIQVLVRRRWTALAVFVAVLCSGVLYSIRTPRIYRSSTVLLINQRTPEYLGRQVEGFSGGDNYTWVEQQNYYETQYKVILSRPVIEQAMNILGLNTAALKNALITSDRVPIQGALLDDPLLGLSPELTQRFERLGFVSGSREELLEKLDEFNAVSFYQGLVELEPVKNSRLVNLHVDHRDPEFAAQLANALAESYINYNLNERINTTRSAVDWLSNSVLELKDKLNKSEQALQSFKEENQIISVSLRDRQSMTSQTLAQLNEKLSKASADLVSLGSQRRQLQKALAKGTPSAALDEIATNKHIQSLKAKIASAAQQTAELKVRYTNKHPKVVAAQDKLSLLNKSLKAEIQLILKGFEHKYQALVGAQKGLKQLIATEKEKALGLNQKELAYRRLEREAKKNLDLYSLVLTRQKEAQLSQMLKVNNINQLEPAVAALAPIRPRLHRIALLSLLMGLILSIGAAFVRDFIDNSIKTQSQIETDLGLAFLGILPSIHITASESANDLSPSHRDHFIVINPRSSIAECCRTIRTNLLFMAPDSPAQTLMVTSSNPREGKSTTAINLAISMAQSGAKTILVDADLRRPRLHKTFTTASSRGVTNCLVGTQNPIEIIHTSEIENLDVLPCGPIPPNPAELLHTDKFRNLLAWLTKNYDRVIFDTPPVSAVSDALILSSMVDGVIFVAQAATTTLPAARFAKNRLLGVGANIMGTVLNDVDLDSKKYGNYYQYYYRSGYYAEEENPVNA